MSSLDTLKPKGYLLAALAVSIGGFLNGYDTGSIGAVTVMPYFEKTFGVLSPFLRGVTVSLIMLTGAIPSLFGGYLSDSYGRLSVAGLGAAVFLVGVVLEASASKLSLFLVGRAFAGMGEGFYLGCMIVYVTEIAPSATRGKLVSVPQLLTTAGVCSGYFTCYGSVRIQSAMSWRTPFIIQAILAATMAISCVFLPSSPRWLVLHGRREEALRSTERLGIEREEAEKDILKITGVDHEQLERSWWQGVNMIFRPEYRKRTSLAFFTLGAIQLSGIDGVLYYAPTLFEQAGLPEQTAGFLASGVSAILMLVITVPAVLLADRMGRRTSVIAGGIVLTTCMFLIGTLYASSSVHNGHGVGRWVVITSIFVIALTYCFTWGVVGRVYASEIQPAKTRANANSVAQGLGFLTNWLVAFFTPLFLASSNSGVYFLFGGLSLTTVLVLAFYMPETKGQPLESIHQAFNEPVFKGWPKVLRRRLVDPPSRPASRSAIRGIESVSSESLGSNGERGGIEMGTVGISSSLRMEPALV